MPNTWSDAPFQARFGDKNDIIATQMGRVMITTEKTQLDFDAEAPGVRRREGNFPAERYQVNT